jgi:uncharacterized protein
MSEPRKLASILWHRLNAEGCDVCHLFKCSDGWIVNGTATFMEEAEIAHLSYEVRCDASWRAQRGIVRGSIGTRQIDRIVTLDERRRWLVDGELAARVGVMVDLDLNFTPATNLIQFRRLALAVGETVEAPVAWFSIPDFRLTELSQTIRRIDQETYDYAAPITSYRGLLKVDQLGFVLEYPELWRAQAVQRFVDE